MNIRFAFLFVAVSVASMSYVHAQDAPKSEPTKSAAQSSSSKANKADRLDLDTTTVTGNRELPKVLYIVPWKKAELGELPAQPFNTLLDEVLAPVDRDVFKREVKYYQTITEQSAKSQDAPAANTQPAH